MIAAIRKYIKSFYRTKTTLSEIVLQRSIERIRLMGTGYRNGSWARIFSGGSDLSDPVFQAFEWLAAGMPDEAYLCFRERPNRDLYKAGSRGLAGGGFERWLNRSLEDVPSVIKKVSDIDYVYRRWIWNDEVAALRWGLALPVETWPEFHECAGYWIGLLRGGAGGYSDSDLADAPFLRGLIRGLATVDPAAAADLAATIPETQREEFLSALSAVAGELSYTDPDAAFAFCAEYVSPQMETSYTTAMNFDALRALGRVVAACADEDLSGAMKRFETLTGDARGHSLYLLARMAAASGDSRVTSDAMKKLKASNPFIFRTALTVLAGAGVPIDSLSECELTEEERGFWNNGKPALRGENLPDFTK